MTSVRRSFQSGNVEGPDVPFLHSDHPVTLLGGAEHRREVLDEALSLAPTLVAADGGADAALLAGLQPAAVVGDMDSISDAAAQGFQGVLHRIAEQETTDFDKVLRSVATPLAIAIGFSGGRVDHELAVLNTLIVRSDRPCIVAGSESVAFLCPPRLRLPLAPGTLVSLFPMAPCRVASSGLRWPTEGLDFAPTGRIGTSNEATGPVEVRPSAPVLLVILPRPCLAAAARALAGSGWPAPADPAFR